MADHEVEINNMSQAYSDAYESGFARAISDKEAGNSPLYTWPEDGEAYARNPLVEGYIDAGTFK